MTQSSAHDLPNGVKITGALATGYDEILTPDALSFVAKFHRAFESRRRQCHRAAEENTGRSSRRERGIFPAYP
jgi:malate synthase